MPPAGARHEQAVAQRRSENLAFLFQEILTVIVRLRSGRHAVQDAEIFRAQMREALRQVDQQARLRGYSSEDVNLAIFAVVALLDETILTTRNPVFAHWARKPMQEELFGHHVAGEIFFQNLQALLGLKDSQELADLLEVYYLCLLLGFAGRYGAGGRGELRSITQAVAEKIRRIRAPGADFSPAWLPPAEAVPGANFDPWVRRLAWAAAGSLALAALLFLVFRMLLTGDMRELAGLLA
ncbi:MAG: DotU family type IV/VI secretion system protein [Bryobacteraceae bacterium]|nr:DotU family type IV/VI secretion system protein [Bryobacteraceae bacterium]